MRRPKRRAFAGGSSACGMAAFAGAVCGNPRSGERLAPAGTNWHLADIAARPTCPLRVDSVEKLKNETTAKSRGTPVDATRASGQLKIVEGT